ncbi:MAG TPA: globin [Kofleriaceae bacterium]|nr:globin [Kofleriaceae bacterium]
MVDYTLEFEKSFARVTDPALSERFFARFYQRFFAADPRVGVSFGATDMGHQQQMLRESLAEMAEFARTRASNPYIITLARVHGVRGRDIPVDLFDTWLDCLVDTVREIDPEATESVAAAWRIVMAPGIEFMKFYRTGTR